MIMDRKNVVIIGNGMVGNKICEKLKQKSNNLEIGRAHV
jgi:nitrite reductase (NADH) large subunit